MMALKVFQLVIYLGIVFSSEGSFRLSPEITPNHYSIKIRPDFDNEIFHGEVKIYVNTKSDLQNITLHSAELNITNVKINQKTAVYSYEQDEKLAVKFENEDVQPGEHIVFIQYFGKLSQANVGFIKAPYEYYGKKKYIYVTELEPTYARNVFPCFDEPAFKAKFNVRLVAPNDTFKAISNMPEIAKFSTSEGVVYDFATSVKMSTYLLSFTFTDYTYYEEFLNLDDDRKIPIRIYTLNASRENNAFAVECTKNAIKFYSEYTNISYPLPKLDMIEYNRTESAATENWGLITFREGLLTPSLHVYSKSQIKIVIYHELSHFWFGNLVTNSWWNDIWLQEGFATYMSYKLSAMEENTTQVEEMKSFQFDDFFENEISFPTSSIVSYLSNTTDILGKFNSIIYEKGAGVILMLEDLIGEEKFKQSIRKFLSAHAFGSATTNDFITVVEEIVPDVNIRSFLESFLYQNKFPVVEVKNFENGTYILKQKVCLTVEKDERMDRKWTIPITYITDQIAQPKLVWFDRDTDKLEIQEKEAKWIVFNPQGKGMYKTVLPGNMWKTVAKYFQCFDKLAVDTLISDAHYSFRFNIINCDVLIELIQNTKNPTEWILFFPFYDYLTERLVCDYPNETELFLRFMERRFDETNYKKSRLHLLSNCSKRKTRTIEQENLVQCVKWIQENLQPPNAVNITIEF
ncbi:hypothetical protein JTB14_030797 [Gonioctena quinquepunctata]|nr:hypothetical protein JTB14_030797 [Gonioctena quinquepunctata]